MVQHHGGMAGLPRKVPERRDSAGRRRAEDAGRSDCDFHRRRGRGEAERAGRAALGVGHGHAAVALEGEAQRAVALDRLLNNYFGVFSWVFG